MVFLCGGLMAICQMDVAQALWRPVVEEDHNWVQAAGGLPNYRHRLQQGGEGKRVQDSGPRP